MSRKGKIKRKLKLSDANSKGNGEEGTAGEKPSFGRKKVSPPNPLFEESRLGQIRRSTSGVSKEQQQSPRAGIVRADFPWYYALGRKPFTEAI